MSSIEMEKLLHDIRILREKTFQYPYQYLDYIYRMAIECIDSSDSVVDLVPWGRQLIDVLNLYLSFHRSTVVGDLSRKMFEAVRPRYLPTLMSMRSEMSPFTYVSPTCMSIISLLTAVCNQIGLKVLQQIGINRFSTGIFRITSIIARTATKNGFYLDRKTLLGMLYELKNLVDSVAYIVP